MGSKGGGSGNMAPVQAQDQSINQNQGQTSTYAPTGGGYIYNALNQGQAAAQTPFQAPVAPVQGFSKDQTDAFARVRNAQGMAQPYYNTAQGLFNKSAQGPNINQFFNPYAGAVMGNLNDMFGEQMSQNDGRLTQAAGGVGADRIAVGHAALAKQQGQVAGQTMASLYAPSLQAAMQEQNILQNAGYGIGALGQQAQNSVFSGAQQQLGMGGLQQQLGQAQLNAPYQNTLARLAYPFQTAQFNAGITGSLAPGLGGTNSGTGYSQAHVLNNTARPGPSPFSQILGGLGAGVGLAGQAGMFNSDSGSSPWGSSPSYGGGNWWGGDAYGGSGSNPLPGLDASDYGAGYAEGGGVEASPYDLPLEMSHRPIDIGAQSIVPDVKLATTDPHMQQLNLAAAALPGHDTPPPQQQKSEGESNPLSTLFNIGKTVLPFFLKDGGRVSSPYESFDEGGSTFDDRFDASFPSRNQQQDQPSPFEDAQWPYGPQGADAVNRDDPIRETPTRDLAAFRQDRDSAMSYADTGDTGALPPRSMAAATNDVSPYSAGSAGPARASSGRDSFSSSPWAALTAAGLGIMAGTSPYAGVNIGQGGLAGLKALQEQRAASQKDETIDQAARRLDLEAKHHEDQYTRQTVGQRQSQEQADRPYRELTMAQKVANQREKYVDAGLIDTADGLHPALREVGGTKIIDAFTGLPPAATDKFKPKSTKVIDDSDAEALANYYVKTGDASRLNGLGISGEARQRVQHFVTRAQKDLGVSDEEMATRKAEWEGRKAGQRVLGTQEAKMGSAAMEAEGAIKQARGVIEKLPRTSFLPLNKLIQGYQTNRLNPDQAELYGRTQAIVNTYSAVMSRGANVTTDSARGHAAALLNTAGNAETYNRMLDTMLQEIDMAKHSPARMREFYRKQYGPKSVAETADAAAPESAASGKPKQRTQNGVTFYLQPDGSYQP